MAYVSDGEDLTDAPVIGNIFPFRAKALTGPSPVFPADPGLSVAA